MTSENVSKGTESNENEDDDKTVTNIAVAVLIVLTFCLSAGIFCYWRTRGKKSYSSNVHMMAKKSDISEMALAGAQSSQHNLG